ncbi:hypothetical protein NGK36_22410 [Hafnia alvei]|uniref:hypothetical protein n=1 Tax=Hafnia alvei TaxID=569 RepID=UPI002DBF9BF1|nr:hypothetical protein [Hafnia alvei]MEB7892007.1 hypothetical protein [Hafnia alvei]
MLMAFVKKTLPIINISSMIMIAANVNEIKSTYQNYSTGYDLIDYAGYNYTYPSYRYAGYKYTSSLYRLDNEISDKLIEHHINKFQDECNEDYNCASGVENFQAVKKNGSIKKALKKELKNICKYTK